MAVSGWKPPFVFIDIHGQESIIYPFFNYLVSGGMVRIVACRVEILDSDGRDLFETADPEKISGQSPLWERDVQSLRPWTRMHSTGIDQTGDTWVWRSEQTDKPISERFGDTPGILVCGRCASTMDAAWHFIETGRMRVWDSVIAVEQTAGRGQHQRQWVSPAGNIHASWCWPISESKTDVAPNWKNLMSLVAGFLFAQTLRKLNVPVEVKWPNDLLIHDRKFGGILIEIRNDHILVGCGINIAFAPEDRLLRDQFAVPATHLVREGFDFTPLALWTTLVTEGKALFRVLVYNSKPSEFIKMIDTRMAWVGKKVAIRGMNDDIVEAVILGLSKDGGLRVKKGDMSQVIYSGSIIPS